MEAQDTHGAVMISTTHGASSSSVTAAWGSLEFHGIGSDHWQISLHGGFNQEMKPS